MKRFINKNTLSHFAIWLTYYVVMVRFSTDMFGFDVALTKGLLTVLIHASVFYLNLLLFLPKLLENKKYLWYILSVLGLVIIVSSIFYYFLEHVFDLREIVKGRVDGGSPEILKLRELNAQNMAKGNRIFFRIFENLVFVILMLLISFIYKNNIDNRRREIETADLKNQMLEAESKMLKWQINPHFLFNTLNNIYSLAQMKSEKTADSIHRLSSMLRYVIYDCSEEYVSIDHEIAYIKAFIELQLLKDDEIKNVRYSFENKVNGVMIAPMLLITFVENSFKHSKIEDLKNGWIDISLITTKEEIKVVVKNSVPQVDLVKDKTKGVGLENVKRRLELLYAGNYELEITQSNDTYSINLTIKL